MVKTLLCRLGRWSLFLPLFLLAYSAHAERSINGFLLKDTLIPVDEILHGGPPRDGIPPIDNPKFVSASGASFLSDDDRVLGLQIDGIAKAYSIGVLNYHEIVNDEFDGRPVTISFCPLCGTGMVFDGQYGDQKVTFGVSGLLYNSDLLMYDRLTDSLWSQIEGKAISGPAKGHTLKQLPVEHTSWKRWKETYPQTRVLSEDTGHVRNYARSPYPYYEQSESVYFPVSHEDKRYHPKEVVVGVSLDGQNKVYPFVELSKHKDKLKDVVGGQSIIIEFDKEHRSAVVKTNEGKVIPSLTGFWFAWIAFHPDSEVYKYKKP